MKLAEAFSITILLAIFSPFLYRYFLKIIIRYYGQSCKVL